MRCPDCNKFVGNEPREPELNIEASLDYAPGEKPGAASVTGDVRLVLACSDCSTELAEATLDVDVEVKLEHRDFDGQHEVTLDGESAENTDRFEGKGRGMRHYYGAEVSGTLRCSCGAEGELSVTVEEQASGFEQMF